MTGTGLSRACRVFQAKNPLVKNSHKPEPPVNSRRLDKNNFPACVMTAMCIIGMRREFLSLNVADSFLYVVRTFSGLKIIALTFGECLLAIFSLFSDKLAKLGEKMRQICLICLIMRHVRQMRQGETNKPR